jgi:hypothetical protein
MKSGVHPASLIWCQDEACLVDRRDTTMVFAAHPHLIGRASSQILAIPIVGGPPLGSILGAKQRRLRFLRTLRARNELIPAGREENGAHLTCMEPE